MANVFRARLAAASNCKKLLNALAIFTILWAMPAFASDGNAQSSFVIENNNAIDHQLLVKNQHIIEPSEFLRIGADIKAMLDEKIRPLGRRTQQVVALHELLFGQHYFAINYDNSYTKTAQETFNTRSGNCLSLAALYIASARYLGMDAKFQLVDIPNQWDKNQNFNIVLGHVNVSVKVPGHDVTVEFMDTYTADELKKFKSKRISDAEATARYFNNRGAELLASSDWATAIHLLETSTSIYPKFSESWVNLGVGYKLTGRLSDAETAYSQAEKIDGRNMSAINNLHTLYVEQGEKQKAQKLADKIRNHQMKNPYYLASLAEQKIQKHQFTGAVEHLRKAIKIQPLEADFYLLLGQSYFYTGNYKKSEEALQKAVELTRDAADLEKRQKKLHALQNLMAAI